MVKTGAAASQNRKGGRKMDAGKKVVGLLVARNSNGGRLVDGGGGAVEGRG